MNAKELADALNGIEYSATMHMSGSDLMKQAKAAGLVVAYGYSDDLLEFDGAFVDEAGAPGKVLIDANGALPNWNDVSVEEDTSAIYLERKKAARTIEAVWSDINEDFAWTLETDIPHETFTIVEDGLAFSRGIVFALADLMPAPAADQCCGKCEKPAGPQFAKVFQTERGQIVAMLHQDSDGNPAVLFWFDAGIEGMALTHLAIGFADDEEGEANARAAFDNLDQDGVEHVVFQQIDSLREHFGGSPHQGGQ